MVRVVVVKGAIDTAISEFVVYFGFNEVIPCF